MTHCIRIRRLNKHSCCSFSDAMSKNVKSHSLKKTYTMEQITATSRTSSFYTIQGEVISLSLNCLCQGHFFPYILFLFFNVFIFPCILRELKLGQEPLMFMRGPVKPVESLNVILGFTGLVSSMIYHIKSSWGFSLQPPSLFPVSLHCQLSN